MPERLQHPGPSFLREQEVRIGDRRLSAGMAKPADGPDDWWLAVLWVTDAEGIVSFREDRIEQPVELGRRRSAELRVEYLF